MVKRLPVSRVVALQDDVARAHAGVVAAQAQLAGVVGEARRRGLSWAQVAEPLGLTKQAAHLRYASTRVAYEDQPLA